MDKFIFLNSPTSDLPSLIIESDRLRLVIVSDDYAPNIFQEFTSEVTFYMYPSPAVDIEETRNFIAGSRKNIQAGCNLQFVILDKLTEEFLGCCGLHGENSVRKPELGIWLKASAHGNYYGREAIHTLVNWAKQNIDLDYFIYPVDRRNIASVKIPKSLKGKVIKEFTDQTPSSKDLDMTIYRIDRFL
jgi:[ribosomal protein S5]-alanine N-acetyltransferase